MNRGDRREDIFRDDVARGDTFKTTAVGISLGREWKGSDACSEDACSESERPSYLYSSNI